MQVFFLQKKKKFKNSTKKKKWRLIKTATDRPIAVAVVKIGITGDPGCGSGYEQITVTSTSCTPLDAGQ